MKRRILAIFLSSILVVCYIPCYAESAENNEELIMEQLPLPEQPEEHAQSNVSDETINNAGIDVDDPSETTDEIVSEPETEEEVTNKTDSSKEQSSIDTDKSSEEEAEMSSETKDPIEKVTIIDSGTCGPKATWSYDSSNTLTISGSGYTDGYIITEYNKENPDARPDSIWHRYELQPWYAYRSDIKNIVIEKGIVEIGELAFAGCFNVENISIADTVEKIGSCAFRYMRNSLTSLTLPGSIRFIGTAAFGESNHLKAVTLEEGATWIGGLGFCDELETVNLPSTLKTIGYLCFAQCPKLESVELPSGLKTIEEGAFQGGIFESLTIPDSVTSIGDYCEGNPYSDYGPEDTEMGFVFASCKSLKEVVLPDNITQITFGNFYQCTALEEITVPASVQKIENCAFAGCSNLKNVYFEGDAPSIDNRAFEKVRTNCHYPGDNETWTSIIRGNYSGNITWIPYYPEHTHIEALPIKDNVIEPTCVDDGSYDSIIYCAECGEKVSEKKEIIPALDHEYENYICKKCGAEDPDKPVVEDSPADKPSENDKPDNTDKPTNSNKPSGTYTPTDSTIFFGPGISFRPSGTPNPNSGVPNGIYNPSGGDRPASASSGNTLGPWSTNTPSPSGPDTEKPDSNGPDSEGPGSEGPGSEGPGSNSPNSEGPGSAPSDGELDTSLPGPWADPELRTDSPDGETPNGPMSPDEDPMYKNGPGSEENFSESSKENIFVRIIKAIIHFFRKLFHFEN